jgi:Fuc2NAc and GlcNAc transferase
MTLALWSLLGVAAAFLLTGLARRYALARAFLDIPNDRSSHTTPTPRGGGLSIVAVVLATVAVLYIGGQLSIDMTVALVGGGLAVAAVGWIDDRVDLRPRVRLAVHFLAAGWAVAWLGGYPELHLGDRVITLGPWGAAVAVVGIVWLINLYNFMDGSDGLAAGEGVVVGSFGAFLLLAVGQDGLATLSLLVAAACAGFGLWNRPPARIFMGDVGSGFLGFTFGVLALGSERAGALPVVWWALLLGVFVFDATVTLLRRMFKRQRWYAAHRSHAYQRAILSGYSHARVALIVVLVTMVLGVLTVIGTRLPGASGWAALAGWGLLAVLYLLVERRHTMDGR